MNSQELAKILECAEHRWFTTALRARVRDGDRFAWKARYMARTCSLLAFWTRPRPPATDDRATAEELAEVAFLAKGVEREGWSMPADAWAALASKGPLLLPKLAAEVTAAGATLTALGHADDGKGLAERIRDLHAETMGYLRKARAEVTALRAERDGWKVEAETQKRIADLRQVAREEADERADATDAKLDALRVKARAVDEHLSEAERAMDREHEATAACRVSAARALLKSIGEP